MQLIQVDSAVAAGRVHLPLVRAALASAPPDSVGFVIADAFGAMMMASYAPSSIRFGSRLRDGVSTFALSLADAHTLLRAPQHGGERDTLTRIARQLTPGLCICFSDGAVALIKVSLNNQEKVS